MGRAGRTRKNRPRSPKTGRLTLAPKADAKALAGAQPHRSWLPEHLRTSEKAATPLGCLNLLRNDEGDPLITDEQYEAGRLFGVRVGAWRAMIGVPRSTLSAGRASPCKPEACQIDGADCECKRVTDAYNRAYEALTGAGRLALMTVNDVAIRDEPCQPAALPHLKAGLDALCRHFGVSARSTAKAGETKSWRA